MVQVTGFGSAATASSALRLCLRIEQALQQVHTAVPLFPRDFPFPT